MKQSNQPKADSPPKIRILTVDDHFIVRTGLASSINFEPDMEVVAEAATGQEASDLYDEYKPDIMLMDQQLPDMTGTMVTALICRRHPEARIIILSSGQTKEDLCRAYQAGARGYVLKGARREEMLAAIRAVHSPLCPPPAMTSVWLNARPEPNSPPANPAG